jgi:hypothetical protein
MLVSRTVRALFVAAALASASLPAVAVAAPTAQIAPAAAQQVAATTVILGDLECIETEDWGADGDEPYIKVNGNRVWTAEDSVDNGGRLAVNIKANVGDTVSLYDADSPDADDLLGSDVIEADRGTLVFRNDGAHYILDFRPA